MEALFSGVASFFLFHFASHPNSKLYKKIPTKKIKRFQLLPSISIEAKNRVIHFHHWMIFTPAYLFLNQVDHGFTYASIIHGFLLGGIIQGLLYADRFRIVFHAQEYEKIKPSSYNLSFLKRLI